MRRAFELLTERIDDLALLMTLEMGKPIAESRAEISYAADFFRWFSEEAVRIDGSVTRAPSGANRILVVRQPVGVSVLVAIQWHAFVRGLVGRPATWKGRSYQATS